MPKFTRFTIRDVLWLTVVAAMAVGWWLDRRPGPNDKVQLRFENRMIDGKLVGVAVETRTEERITGISGRVWRYSEPSYARTLASP
jgi:hypothetical protein